MDNKKEDEIIIRNPVSSGYKDRKMAKWQGLILSEHNEILNEEKTKNRKINREKEKQSLEKISESIEYSYKQKAIIAIQLDCLFNGKYENDIIGIVSGYFEKNIYIQTIESQLIVCEFELIRNVEEYNLSKWFKA